MKRSMTGLFLTVILVAAFMTGCGSKETEEKEIKSLPENIVFSVNDIQVSLGEWNLYAQAMLERTGNLYGKDIFGYKMDSEGKVFGEAVLENIRERIVNVKVVAEQAQSLGVELTEDDKMEISIAAMDYMDKLTDEEKETYSITEETVNEVYSDNYLATKVYEHITLNVDTETEEIETRHMVLRYIMQPKSYEDREGNTVFFEETELAARRADLSTIRERAAADISVSIKDFESDKYVVTETIIDYDGLRERLPEDMAGIVFWLRQNEVSEILESEDAFFVFECVKLSDEESTMAARIKIVEERERQEFSKYYEEWKKDAVIVNNEPVWKMLTDRLLA